jgi:hypothetical protein
VTTVLADDEMAPWRVVVPGAWRRQYAASGAARSGSVLPEGDDDVVAEGLELAVCVAGLAAAVGVPGVPVGTEVAAASYLQQALALFREIFLATGHPAQARAHHAYALSLARQAGHQVQQARACDGLGRACHAAGDTARARRHWQEALTLYASLGTPEADQLRAQLATDCA